MTDRDRDLADQPPEVEHLEPGHPTSLPPVAPASERVAAFIRWFGDGTVLNADSADDCGFHDPAACPPLYARDLEALVRFVDSARTHTSWELVRNGDSYTTFGDREDSEQHAREAFAVRAHRLRRGESLRLDKTVRVEAAHYTTTTVESIAKSAREPRLTEPS